MKIQYINNPVLPVTVTIIGAGGNGSQILNQLGRIDYALKSLGKPGLMVHLIDADRVTEANLGRQLFCEQEVGQFKSNVLISRINRFYGLSWRSLPQMFTDGADLQRTNLIITCTDNVASRKAVHKWIKKRSSVTEHEWQFHYWIDLGNTKNTGQVICGSPKYKLPTVVELFPKMRKMEVEDDTPSCSLAQALSKQDLFVNTFMADVAAKLIWEMCTKHEVDWQGAFINLERLNFKKIAA